MGAWSLYFLAKVGLYYDHAIGLHLLPNLLLAAALAWPLEKPRLRLARTLAAVPLAAALLYFDSYLPPFARVLEQAGALGGFRAGYLVELLQRFISLRWILILVALCAAYVLVAHRLRFATLAFAALFAPAFLPTTPPATPVDPAQFTRAGEAVSLGPDAPNAPPDGPPLTAAQLDTTLENFYGHERGRMVSFERAGTANFDLVILSVCSLAVDDLQALGLRAAPPLGRFDIVFRQFNSAATYSGPAVLRLLQGTCGQPRQADLYGGAQGGDCYLFRSLAAAGYRPALLLNHDGKYGDFLSQLRSQGGVDAGAEDNRYAPAAMTAFDGTPVREDYAVLSQWWQRHATGDAHVALIYNTISLHDGNRLPGAEDRSSMETYGTRTRRLLADLNRFIDLIEAQGRPTVIVLIPEHGVGLRGDAVQVPGLRELPTPAITQVPAAVKLVGFGARLPAGQPPIVIDRPSSYLALTTLVAGLMHAGPDKLTAADLATLVRQLPGTPWVAENEATLLLREGGRSYLRDPNRQWTQYAAAPIP